MFESMAEVATFQLANTRPDRQNCRWPTTSSAGREIDKFGEAHEVRCREQAVGCLDHKSKGETARLELLCDTDGMGTLTWIARGIRRVLEQPIPHSTVRHHRGLEQEPVSPSV